MKKEKTIRTYQRKTKSGKITTVKSHTAKYDAAAEVAKKAARKKGAGGELQAKITKMPDPKLELQQYLDGKRAVPELLRILPRLRNLLRKRN